MKRKFLSMMLVAVMVTFGSCVGDDIDDLQGQIDELTEEVKRLDAAQKAALTAQLELLMVEIEALQEENAQRIANSEAQAAAIEQLEADYADLLAQLGILEDLINQNAEGIEGNKNMIYFGDVNNESAYAAFAAQEGASVIVGEVKIESQAQAEALANVTYIGGDVEVVNVNEANSEVVLPNIKTIAGALMVGPDWDKTNKYGNPSIMTNEGLIELSMPELKFIGSVRVNNWFQPEGSGEDPEMSDGLMSVLNLGGASVSGDAWFAYLNKATALSIGAVAGNLNINKVNSAIVEINGNIGGDFTLYGSKLVSLLTGSCSSIGGDVIIESNGHTPQGGEAKGMTGELLPNVTNIGGNVKLSGNQYLPGTNNEVNWFKNLTNWNGLLIDIYEYKTGCASLKLFNQLADDRFINYSPYGKPTIKVIVPEGLKTLEAFNAVTKMHTIQFNAANAVTVTAFNKLIGCSGASSFDFSGAVNVDALNAFSACQYSSSAVELRVSSTQSLCSMKTFLNSVVAGTFVGTPTFFVDDAEVTDVATFVSNATSGC